MNEELQNKLPHYYGFGNRLQIELRNNQNIAVYYAGNQKTNEIEVSGNEFVVRNYWHNKLLAENRNVSLENVLDAGLKSISLSDDPHLLNLRKAWQSKDHVYIDLPEPNQSIPVAQPAGYHFHIKLVHNNPNALFDYIQEQLKKNPEIALFNAELKYHTYLQLDHHINLKVKKVQPVLLTSSLARLHDNISFLYHLLKASEEFADTKYFVKLIAPGITPCMQIIEQHQGGARKVAALCSKTFDLRNADIARKKLAQYLGSLHKAA